jgi:hypothetical protein
MYDNNISGKMYPQPYPGCGKELRAVVTHPHLKYGADTIGVVTLNSGKEM